MPLPRSSRPNCWSYNKDARTTKPISAVAMNGRLHHSRFNVSIFCTVRQLSAYEGTASSVTTTSSRAPVASRSQRPRVGSTIRKARTANTTVGTAKTRNGTRHPNEKASSPAASGPTKLPTALAARCVLNTPMRDWIG